MIRRWSNRLFGVLRAQLRRGALFLLTLMTAGTLTLTPVLSTPASAQGLTDLLSLGGLLTGASASCAIEQVGWVVCPTMRSIARLADNGFKYINKSFLRIDYDIASNDSGTYTAWGMMRNIANALFVVAFMVLVYAQLVGRGGGYNMKRLVPKLLICAVLVNVSYFLCVVIIDITNIVGDSIIAIMSGVADKVGTALLPIGGAAGDGPLTSITSAIMSKPDTAWVLLTPVAAVIISVATICAAGVVLLIMRKVVIAMLILASPILFVAYLLPNLEKYFFQAIRLFMQLLLLYPIIALLLGAGQIVDATIITVGSNDANYRMTGDNYPTLSGSGSAITDTVAAAASVLPLLAVWFIFKNMSSIMSSAGTRLSASIAGRRGGKSDEKARVTGNATAGAASIKLGGAGGLPNRRQAFSRNRRRSSLGGSNLTGGDEGGESLAERAGTATQQTGSSSNAVQNALDSSIRGESENSAKQLEELQNARMNGQADQLDIGSAVASAVAASEVNAKGDKKEDEITAKDLFNNLNRSHESKDKDRKFSAGPAPAGSGGGGGGGSSSGGGGAQPSAPVTSYRAPQIAQSGNIISGSSAPSQPIKIVAVPIQVDASSLLGHSQDLHRPPDNVSQPPISGTEEKAKARAQKYLFDSERSLDEDRDKQDILGHKDAPTEPPHVTVGSGQKHDEDS